MLARLSRSRTREMSVVGVDWQLPHGVRFPAMADVLPSEELVEEPSDYGALSPGTRLGRYELLVPIALHPARLRERGYNQSALLARALTAAKPEQLAEAGLRRVRRTDAQASLSASERARNVDGAFRADPRICAGRAIVLIDDVCTTGATLRAAAAALRDAGATEVSAAVIAAAVS